MVLSEKFNISLPISHVQKYKFVDFLYTEKQWKVPMNTQTNIRSSRGGFTFTGRYEFYFLVLINNYWLRFSMIS